MAKNHYSTKPKRRNRSGKHGDLSPNGSSFDLWYVAAFR
jgi:hypothetical protein